MTSQCSSKLTDFDRRMQDRGAEWNLQTALCAQIPERSSTTTQELCQNFSKMQISVIFIKDVIRKLEAVI